MSKYRIYGFEKLSVWQDAKSLSVLIYRETSNFPIEEKFGSISQLRRASVSISSNIAEGSSRNTDKDKSHFYGMAYSSLMEVLSQLLVSRDLNFISEENISILRKEIEKVFNKLNSLRNSTDN